MLHDVRVLSKGAYESVMIVVGDVFLKHGHS